MRLVEFLNESSFDNRKDITTKIRASYSDRIPIGVFSSDDKDPNIRKHKYIVPESITVGKFIYELRQNMQINSSMGLYFFTENGILLTPGELIITTYRKYKNDDGFLYIIYSLENTFGN